MNFLNHLIPLFKSNKYIPPKSREELYRYWCNPVETDNDNNPQDYMKGMERSNFLLEFIRKYSLNENDKILEIGCNVGRNLNCLYNAGFHSLNGVEINENAVRLLEQTYIEMAQSTEIYNIPIENIIKDIPDNRYSITFTMAVLEHIHTDSEWVFAEMVRITKDYIIVIEDEKSVSDRHFPRNYKNVFESCSIKQIKAVNCKKIEGLSSNFNTRVFKKI